MDGRLEILTGDCRAILPTLEPESVQCCVTSPPYWGLRDYGTAQWEGGKEGCDHKQDRKPADWSSSKLQRNKKTPELSAGTIALINHQQEPNYGLVCRKCGALRIDSQLGLESTPEEYITKMVAVFRELWRVLRDDGTLWVNMGDSYASGDIGKSKWSHNPGSAAHLNGRSVKSLDTGLKPKDLCMMPARLAMALQADGWYLRSEIVWAKPNPMPESVTDRPTKSHEMIYLLAKQERYFYDAEAIREPQVEPDRLQRNSGNGYTSGSGEKRNAGVCAVKPAEFATGYNPAGRNKRSVWTIATQPYSEAHFATFPEEIPKLCIMAGSKPGDTILDPFAGSGTVGKVALELGRRAIMIELNPAYIELAHERTNVTPGWF